MDVAIGLPNAVPGTAGAHLVEWARRAGCDELLLFPSSGNPDQADLLAGAVGL